MSNENIITESDSIKAAKVRASKARYAEKVKRLNASLSPDEYELLCRRAEQAGRTPTAFLKELAFRQLRRQNNFIVPAELEQRLSQLIEQTRRLGNNTNQLAKEAYVNGVNSTKLEQARRLIFELEDAVKTFVRHPSLEK